MSNYPPGVTGNEYEIAGPDTEDEVQDWCDHCESVQNGVVQTYRREAWFICDACGETTEMDRA